MKSLVKNAWKVGICFLIVMMSSAANIFAQEKVTVQIKTFTQQLEPYRNLEVSINGGAFISVGSRGSVVSELSSTDFPIKSVVIKNEELEAASWLFTKGIVEIIVRKKSYQMASVFFRSPENQPVSRVKVTFRGRKNFEATTDAEGKIQIPLALDEQITGVSQFSMPEFQLRNLSANNNQYTIVSERVRPVVTEPVASAAPATQQQKATTAKDYFKNFDLSKLDSIQSLTMFYAIFKDYQINELSREARQRVDAKFNQLVQALQDSSRQDRPTSFIGRIDNSTLLRDDIRNLISQARQESETLTDQRIAFDEKIQIITNKLESGISNMSEETRAQLLSELSLLERLLIENESRFFKNQNDYRAIINAIKEKYFNFKDLENKLSESEAQRLEEQRIFRERLLAISAVVLVFAALIVLLIIVLRKLRRQAKELAAANAEVKRINENLEGIVLQRTKLLAEANKELDTFLYRASHDMRSPVRSIIGLCNIAGQLVEGESKELIERVTSTSMGMDKLLKKLSLISEINEPTDFTSITLRETIEDIQYGLRDVAPNTKFIINCPADLVVSSYRNLIHIILQNLIENGLYYGSLDNNKSPEVQVNAKRQENSVVISVQDNGMGFDPSIKDKLFDMFFKGTEKSKGHGLGLYIVSKAIQALGGTIHVESKAGAFTKFEIALPLNEQVNTEVLESKAVA